MRDLAKAELDTLLAQRDEVLEQIVSAFLSAEEMGVDSMFLEIRAGTGGVEAGLFAGVLAEMFRRFCEKNRWKFEVLDFSPEGSVGGFREFVAKHQREGAYREALGV